jgi:signal recognition particle GTPase
MRDHPPLGVRGILFLPNGIFIAVVDAGGGRPPPNAAAYCQAEQNCHAVLLVLDATVGQNALSQVEEFSRVAGVTGLVMTKLDGTARGGILAAIAAKYGLPVHFIGVGEGIDDLAPFAARDFARALAGSDLP